MSRYRQGFMLRYGKTIIYFGIGALQNLDNIISSSCRRVYIITGRNAAYVSGAFADVKKILDVYGIDYEVYSNVASNPTHVMVDEIADKVKKFEPNYVVAIGGGSVIDTAKVASALAVCGGSVKDYIVGGKLISGSKPVIAINLTHGTGSEINRYAVVTIDMPKTKYGLASEYFYPVASFNDPRYTLTMPYKQIIYTTLDAFYHAYEAVTGRDCSPYVLLIAEEVAKIIARWLPIAIENPKDLETRYWLLYVSMLAGIAIDNSRAHLIHAIENVLSGINTNLPHGAGLAMIGPHVTKYIHKAVPENSYRILKYLDPDIRPTEEDAERASEAVMKFQRLVGFNERLSDYGFTHSDARYIIDVVFNVLSYGMKLTPFNVDEDIIKTVYLKSL